MHCWPVWRKEAWKLAAWSSYTMSCWFEVWILLSVDLGRTSAKLFGTQMSSNIIDTQYGKLRGVLVTLPNKNLPQVEAYLGIQFASVLGGDLRFMPPTSSIEKWDGVRVALKYRPVCPQKVPNVDDIEKTMTIGRVEHFRRLITFLDKQSEECLNLNIYVPFRDKNDTSQLSVLVFIHGESYDVGTGNAYDGSVISAYGHVIVITLNYRLGVLGFLSTGDSNAPGNYAFLDQVAALHWIKENIPAFGGDPNSITLLGHGYGAAMVNLLMISPVTKGRNLFQRAIIQSGSSLSTWFISGDPVRYTRELAEKVNCTGGGGENGGGSQVGNSAGLLQCLKHVPVDLLVRTEVKAPKYFSAFGPTIDKRSVLPTDVRRLMTKTGESVFSTVRLLAGVTRNEGFMYFGQHEVEDGLSIDRLHQIARTYVQNVFTYHKQYIYDLLVHQYTDWDRPNDPAAFRDSMMELIGDGQYVAPVIDTAQLHARLGAPTYLYSFNYPARLDAYPRWAGGVHGDDLSFVFGAPLTDGIDPFSSIYTRSDKLLAETVLKYWTNFIKTGNPNEQDSRGSRGGSRSSELEWPIYDVDRQEYLHIERRMQDRSEEATKPVVRHHYRGAKMALWLDLIPRLHRSDNLDVRYHLLDNHDNLTTFEADGTQWISLHDLLSTTTPEPTLSTQIASTSTVTSTTVSTTLPTSAFQLSTIARTFQTGNATLKTKKFTLLQKEEEDESYTDEEDGIRPTDRPSHEMGHALSLSVTIAVGSALLFLNILVFAAVYYQKDRMQRERRLMKLELEQDMMGSGDFHHDHHVVKDACGDGKGRDSSPKAYTNSTCSPALQIPPAPFSLTARKHQQQQQQKQMLQAPPPTRSTSNTLPKKLSIPVTPPQPPYAMTTSRKPPPSRYASGPGPTLPVGSGARKLQNHSGVLDGNGSGGGIVGVLKNSISHDSSSIDSCTGHHSNPSTVV